MNNIQTALITLILNAVCGTNDSVDIKSADDICKLAQLAAEQDMLNIISKSLLDGNIVEDAEIIQQLTVEQYGGALRYQKHKFVTERLCSHFDDAQICYVLLKGTVIRDFYPEPDMRTSSDIDILVKSEDMDRASSCLLNNLGCTEFAHTDHDVSYITEDGVHIELHHTLVSDRFGFARPLADAWKHAKKTFGCRYDFDNEFFVYYHLAHIAKHLINGGFGIRFVLDLWLMMQNLEIDQDKLDNLLMSGGIKKLFDTVWLLGKVWFENCDQTDATCALEKYIFESGLYGVLENNVAVNQRINGGRFGNLIYRIFMPAELLKVQYPILEKHKALYPICLIRRFCRILRRNRRKAVVELTMNTNTAPEKTEEINNLFNMLEM